MTTYTVKDAERDLQAILDRAPSGAVTGDWEATTLQAGHSSRSGSYHDAGGDMIEGPAGHPLVDIEDAVERLKAGTTERFNRVHVRWAKATLPFMKGKVTVEISFDARIVPRGSDHPAYDAAAKARRAYWESRGEVDADFAAERLEANAYGQTKWFNPHRRVLHIRGGGQDLLATDGLSTPWSGIAEEENGVECEILLAFEQGKLDDAGLRRWADLMIGIGDLVADGYRVARDVGKNGAILFCRTGESYLPLSRIILSRTGQTIPGLPFGSVPVIRATAVAEEEIAGGGEDDDWGTAAARKALERRGSSADVQQGGTMTDGKDGPLNAAAVEATLRAVGSEEGKADVARFFHDGLGETQVLGVGIGKVFPVAKAYKDLPLAEIERLLDSPFYETRMAAAAIMDFQAREKKPANSHADLYDLYLRRHDRLNNWDLVDRSAMHVVGRFLEDKPHDPLRALAQSPDWWRRRTAVVATAYYLRKGHPDELFAISDILAGDPHVMVQKAVGSWIRTAGEEHPERLRAFLSANKHRMPATALRIATEKMSAEDKAAFRR